jgi:hypothetical protein
MRTLFKLLGSLVLLAVLATPAGADGMRPLNGGRGSIMLAPTPPLLRFHGQTTEHDHQFIRRHIARGQARQFIIVNPGPVPPLTGTIVPPFTVGHTVHHRFAFGRFPMDHRRGHFHRFHQGFPVGPFILLETPAQTEMFGDVGEGAGNSVAEASSTEAPAQSAAAAAKPMWRSGQSVLTGTLEEPRVIVVNPSRDSRNVRIFAPSTELMRAPQIVEVPAQ